MNRSFSISAQNNHARSVQVSVRPRNGLKTVDNTPGLFFERRGVMRNGEAKFRQLVKGIQRAMTSTNALLADSAAKGRDDADYRVLVGKHEALSMVFCMADDIDTGKVDLKTA